MKKSLVILFMAALLAGTLIQQEVSAQEPQRTGDVEVGLYLLNLGRFDVATGAFTADFYLSLKCLSTCSQQDFEFVNGRAASIDKIIDLPNEKFYRIQANLNSPVNLRKFPFDEQKMQIIIEDKKTTRDFLKYVPNEAESGIDESIVFTGWNLGEWTVEEREHFYAPYDEFYSQYVFTIPISRIKINSVIKTFLPIFFIITVMLSSFFLDTEKITTRLAMAGSALVASVMFHISITNQIPPVGYLTFADKFMVTTYFIILLSFIMNVIMLELHERKKIELLNKIHSKTEYTIFFIVALIYMLLFIFGL